MLGWSYLLNVEAGEDIRIPVVKAGSWPMSARGEILPGLKDYWLFDSSDLWVMLYVQLACMMQEAVLPVTGRASVRIRSPVPNSAGVEPSPLP